MNRPKQTPGRYPGNSKLSGYPPPGTWVPKPKGSNNSKPSGRPPSSGAFTPLGAKGYGGGGLPKVTTPALRATTFRHGAAKPIGGHRPAGELIPLGLKGQGAKSKAPGIGQPKGLAASQRTIYSPLLASGIHNQGAKSKAPAGVGLTATQRNMYPSLLSSRTSGLAKHPKPAPTQAPQIKAPTGTLQPTPVGLISNNRKRTSYAFPSSGLNTLAKRTKMSSTPPRVILGQLAANSAAPVYKRAMISPSIREPLAVPVEGPPAVPQTDPVRPCEGALDVLPVQRLCELLSDELRDDFLVELQVEAERQEQRAEKSQRKGQLIARIRNMLSGPEADEWATREVLDHFLQKLKCSEAASRTLATKGLSLVVMEGRLRDGPRPWDQPVEEDTAYTKLLPGCEWLLQDLPKLPLFDAVRGMTSDALQQAILIETDPQAVSAYVIYLSQHAPVEDHASHTNLALNVARLITQRPAVFSMHSGRPECHAVLSASLAIFSTYVNSVRMTKRMRKAKEANDLYSWSESQEEAVFLRWATGETATMHAVVIHAIVILLTLGPPQGDTDLYNNLLNIWFPAKKPLPTACRIGTSEESPLLPDWLKLRMIQSEVPQMVDAALQHLEPQQLVMFVQSFGIPVSNMTKLLQCLDQAVPHTLEQNILNKQYMANLVEVQLERGATAGHTFLSLLRKSAEETLPSPRRDAAEVRKTRAAPEAAPNSVKTSAGHQIPVIGPEDDLACVVLQLFSLKADPRWQATDRPASKVAPASPGQLSMALQQALMKELLCSKLVDVQQAGLPFRLLQAVDALLTSDGAKDVVLAMHRGHAISCPLMHQLCLYRRLVPQDTAFSSLFATVTERMTTGLNNLTVEAGPLHALLKAFAVEFNLKREHSGAYESVHKGFLHLAETLANRGDTEVPVRTIIAMLKGGHRCTVEAELIGKVLQGLMEIKSPYLEELLSLLMLNNTQDGAAGSVAMILSLLLQDSEEQSWKKEVGANHNSAVMKTGLSSGLLVDWLERLDPEVISVCPDMQRKLLFALNKGGTPAYRPYLLARLIHQSNWTTLLQCISALLGKQGDQRLDPSSVLEFLGACSRIPRVQQGRKTLPKEDKFVLQLNPEEVIGLVDLILLEAEHGGRNSSHDTFDEKASISLIQSRLPLLKSCCSGNLENITKIAEYLINCPNKSGDGAMSKPNLTLLLQIYLHFPEVIQHVTLPFELLNSEALAAADGTTSKLDGLAHHLLMSLADTDTPTSLTDANTKKRTSDANISCRKLAESHPVILLRHLPMIAGLLHSHLNFPESKQQSHLTFFTNVLAILAALQPFVFHGGHRQALHDCLLSFMKIVQNLKSGSHLDFIDNILQFTQTYVAEDEAAAIPYLQSQSDILQGLSSKHPQLMQLKSLLDRLNVPLKSSSEVEADDKDDDSSVGSLPQVDFSISYNPYETYEGY